MDKLNNDEMILIMLSMKKQYEKQYKIMEDKFNSLSKYCKESREEEKHILTNNDTCSCCNGYTYDVNVIGDVGWMGMNNNNYYNCSGCNKVICDYCINNEDFCITEYRDNPLPNNFWCKKCDDFNIKMKLLK